MSEPTIAEKAKRFRLRKDLHQYLVKGAIERDTFRILLQPTVEEKTRKPINNTDKIWNRTLAIQSWDFELSCYIRSRFGEDRALWFMNKTPSDRYPSNIGDAPGLSHSWDVVTSNLSKIDQLLKEFPELPGGAKAAELADKASASDRSVKNLIHWAQEDITGGTGGDVYRTKVVISTSQNLDDPIFDVIFDLSIISASIEYNAQSVLPPPIVGNVRRQTDNYHFELLQRFTTDRPVALSVESKQPITVKDIRVRLW